MPLNFEALSTLNIQGLGAWPEVPTPFSDWNLPTDFTPVLSLENAFLWRWRTGSIQYHYKHTRSFGGQTVVLEEETITLEPKDIADTTPERWVLGPDIIFEGELGNGAPHSVYIHFAAQGQGSGPWPVYQPNLWNFVLMPEHWAALYPEDGFSLTLNDTVIAWSYELFNGLDTIERTYTRSDW